MSIKIMSRIWEEGPDQQGELLVLLALSDWANDEGDCWPSMAGIARKTRIEERSARRIIRRLEEAGWLSVVVNGGRHGCNQYRINPDPKSPGHNVPRTEKTLTPDPPVPPPRTHRSPEPSITIKEPPVSKRGSRLAEDWFLPTAWGEWALGEGFSEAAIRDQAERFRDYWHAAPAARGVKADWLATWRTWMRNARDRQPQLKAITGGRNDRAQFAVAHREYTRRIAAGEVNRGPDPSDPFGGR